MIQKGAIKLQYVSTDEKVVDVLMKPLSRIKFEHFRDKLGVVQKDLPRPLHIALMDWKPNARIPILQSYRELLVWTCV